MLDCIGAHGSEGCFWLGAIGRDHLSQIGHDFGREPTLAFEAMKYREADEICHQEWLHIELGQRKINDVPLCSADSHLRIRLAWPAEMLLYRQAAEANKLSDDGLAYLIELDVVVSFR